MELEIFLFKIQTKEKLNLISIEELVDDGLLKKHKLPLLLFHIILYLTTIFTVK